MMHQLARWTGVALTCLCLAYQIPLEASGDDVSRQIVSFTVEASAFGDGGQGCWPGPFYCGGGHYDETPGNWGDAQVRSGTDVDLWYDDGGIVIGGLDGLEWLTFPVDVPQSGVYRVTFRTASPADRPLGSGIVNVGVYGVDGSWMGNQIVPVTGGAGEWHQYATWQAPTAFYLPAGAQTITMWAAGGWFNLRNMVFTLQGTPESASDPTIPGQLNSMVLSGFVRDAAGTLLSGAQILFWYGLNVQLVLATDDNGHYEIAFDAIPDQYFGALGWAVVWKDVWTRYELDSQFVKVTTRHTSYDFVLRDIEWITPNGSTSGTIAVDDPVCINNAEDPSFGSNAVCHPLRLIVPADGTLRIEIVPTGPVEGGIELEVETAGGGWIHCCNASGVVDVPVIAGEQVFVNPQAPSGVIRSFTIFTSMLNGPER